MHLRYLGHAAFLLTLDNGVQILMDPFGNPTDGRHWFDREPPPLAPDLVLITHPHFDHDSLATVTNQPTILRDALAVRGHGFRIQGFRGRHARDYGQEFGQKNVIFVLEIDDEGGLVRLCHWGDNRADFDVARLGPTDLLILPVDESEHILDLAEVDEVIARVRPRVVWPVHYHIPGLTSPQAGLGGVDGWLAGRGERVRRLAEAGIEVHRAGLPRVREIWVGERSIVNRE